MHPPLDRPHPQCQDVIKALQECHEKHSAAKFLGACNDEKAALDKCFRVRSCRLFVSFVRSSARFIMGLAMLYLLQLISGVVVRVGVVVQHTLALR